MRIVKAGRLEIHWLWSAAYKGLSVEWDERKQVIDWVYKKKWSEIK